MQRCSDVCIVLLAYGKTHYLNFIGSALLLQNTYVVFACVPCRSCRRIDLVGRCQSLLHSNSSQTKSPPHLRSIIIMRMTTGVLTFVEHQRYVDPVGLSKPWVLATGGSSKPLLAVVYNRCAYCHVKVVYKHKHTLKYHIQHTYINCAVRLFQGMPSLVSSNGQVASISHPATTHSLIAILLGNRGKSLVQGENMLRNRRNCLLGHPVFSCNDVSACTSTVVVREHRLTPWRKQQEVVPSGPTKCTIGDKVKDSI